MEAHVATIDESLALHTTELSDLKEKPACISDSIITAEEVGTRTKVGVKQPIVVTPPVTVVNDRVTVTIPEDVHVQKKSDAMATPSALLSTVVKNGPRYKEDGKWTTVTRARPPVPKKRGVLFGRANNGIIKSVIKPKSKIYVGDIDPSIECRDIKDYLSGAGIHIEHVFCISPLSATTKSFKLIVKPTHYDMVFNADLWNTGTRIRDWND